ncbi:MAG TPA: hypothetical protein VK604_07735 [Bryobacteraceae bacterium]|nr:hypothetical protein [Bryobacteraceae bacterium]
MSSSANALSSGLQKLYDTGLLPDNLSQNTLSTASGSELNSLANSAVALQQIGALLGNGSDSVSLSSDAANSGGYAGYFGADYFTQAVNNQLTNNIDSAVNKFLPAGPTPSGSNIDLVG